MASFGLVISLDAVDDERWLRYLSSSCIGSDPWLSYLSGYCRRRALAWLSLLIAIPLAQEQMCTIIEYKITMFGYK
jgi:hypothetical protein